MKTLIGGNVASSLRFNLYYSISQHTLQRFASLTQDVIDQSLFVKHDLHESQGVRALIAS